MAPSFEAVRVSEFLLGLFVGPRPRIPIAAESEVDQKSEDEPQKCREKPMLVILKEEIAHPLSLSSPKNGNSERHSEGDAQCSHKTSENANFPGKGGRLSVSGTPLFAPERQIPRPFLIGELTAPVAPEEERHACNKTCGHQTKPWHETEQHYFTPFETSYDAGMPEGGLPASDSPMKLTAT